MDFKYRARNAEGKTIKGNHAGQSQYHVVQWLRDQNMVPISVTENREDPGSPSWTAFASTWELA